MEKKEKIAGLGTMSNQVTFNLKGRSLRMIKVESELEPFLVKKFALKTLLYEGDSLSIMMATLSFNKHWDFSPSKPSTSDIIVQFSKP